MISASICKNSNQSEKTKSQLEINAGGTHRSWSMNYLCRIWCSGKQVHSRNPKASTARQENSTKITLLALGQKTEWPSEPDSGEKQNER
jgi:hypothetical protein